jgi:hypothetical protein
MNAVRGIIAQVSNNLNRGNGILNGLTAHTAARPNKEAVGAKTTCRTITAYCTTYYRQIGFRKIFPRFFAKVIIFY